MENGLLSCTRAITFSTCTLRDLSRLTFPFHCTRFLVCLKCSQDSVNGQTHQIQFDKCDPSNLILPVWLCYRYESIVTPFKTRSSVHRKWRTLGAVWLASLGGFCCPFLALALSDGATFTYTDAPQHLPCFMWVEDPTGRRVYFELYYVFVYLVANIVMVICYMKIFRLAKHRISVRMMVRKTSALGQSAEAKTDRRFGIRSNSAGSIRERGDGGGSIENVMGGEAVAGGSSDYTNPQGSKKLTVEPIQKLHDRTLTKMTLIIVSTFMVCWGPHACTSVAIMLRGTTVVVEEIQLCCLALAYSTTILHPLIYTFMRRTFRRNLVVRLQRKLSRRDFGLPSAARVHPLPPSATAQVAATSRAPLTKLSPVPSVSDHSDHLDNSGASKLNYVSFSKDSGIGS